MLTVIDSPGNSGPGIRWVARFTIGNPAAVVQHKVGREVIGHFNIGCGERALVDHLDRKGYPVAALDQRRLVNGQGLAQRQIEEAAHRYRSNVLIILILIGILLMIFVNQIIFSRPIIGGIVVERRIDIDARLALVVLGAADLGAVGQVARWTTRIDA